MAEVKTPTLSAWFKHSLVVGELVAAVRTSFKGGSRPKSSCTTDRLLAREHCDSAKAAGLNHFDPAHLCQHARNNSRTAMLQPKGEIGRIEDPECSGK